MSLAVHLILKNNEKTIEKTLQSLMPLKAKIEAADVGSKDQTIKICKRYGVEVFSTSLNGNFSIIRNKLIERCNASNILSIEPWERLVRGHSDVLGDGKSPFYIQIVQGNLITKEVRLWNRSTGLKYENPVYEYIKTDNAKHLDAIIYSKGNFEESSLKLDILEDWGKKNPADFSIYYYKACWYLSQKKYNEFLSMAQYYLLNKKSKMPVILTRYYTAIVHLHINKNYEDALKNILTCIASKPLMAEFWCLLADIYYLTNQFIKAKGLYENAELLGSKRLQDEWPIEVDKYKKYPSKMIEKCNNAILNKRLYIISELPRR